MLQNTVVEQMTRSAPYDEDWPNEFAVLGQDLQPALSAGALWIDHVGSTSVPGLAAKAVIDIQITVASLDPGIRKALKAIGYVQRPHCTVHIPPGAAGSPDDWGKWVFKEPSGRRATNVVVRAAGRQNQRPPLLFRDFLRSKGAARAAYERMKAAVARLHPEDMDPYTAVKDPVCDIIFDAAEAWGASTKWAQSDA